jgi:hypothetical protein
LFCTFFKLIIFYKFFYLNSPPETVAIRQKLELKKAKALGIRMPFARARREEKQLQTVGAAGQQHSAMSVTAKL